MHPIAMDPIAAEHPIAAEPDAVHPDLFRRGMRSLFSGVCIVSSRHRGERVGLVASSVTSVSMEPPTLLVCIAKTASAHDAVLASGVFAVTILAEDHAEIARIFSSSRRREERFVAGRWTATASGCLVLADAPASFDCRIAQAVDGGTHTIFLGRVLAVETRTEPPPLVYGNGGFGAYVPHAV